MILQDKTPRGTSNRTTSDRGACVAATAIQRLGPPWYKSWLQNSSSFPGGLMVAYNVEPKTARTLDTDWQRDALAGGSLASLVGLATTVGLRRLGLPELLRWVGGAAVGFASSYAGLHSEDRVWGRPTRGHDWYGRYR